MVNHRWVIKHARLLVLAAALAGSSYASWLHLWRLPEASVLDDDRVSIPTASLPHKGAIGDAAKITMLECSDFECPFSRRASGTVDELLARNDDLAFYHLHFPLGMFEHSTRKAIASVAAQRQGRFWEMHDALYDARIESDADAIALARQLGLDTDRFAADLRAPAVRG